MDLKLEKILIVKKGLTGEASVKYNILTINKIVINLGAAEPVAFIKYEGSHVVSGQLVTELKEQILDFFQDVLEGAPDGMYEFIPEIEFTVNKL